MRNLFFVIKFLLIFSLFSASVTASEKYNFDKGFVKGELLVKYTDGTASAASNAANRQIGAELIQEFPEIGWQWIKLPENISVEQAVLDYKNFPGVELAQPNYIYKTTLTPNDPQFGSLYGMTKIDAPRAWNTTTGNPAIVVAVIDTGIRFTHEDLAANMWRNPGEIAGNNVDDDANGYIDDVYGWDVFSNDADPSDEFDHGTHVAGTIGAAGNNGRGVAGVNWNVKLMALKIYDASGNTSTAAHIIRAYQYVRTMKQRGINIRVTNNSYGGAPEAAGYDQATKDAIDSVGDLDVLNVFAAGNAGTNNDLTPFYPSSYNSPTILAVAASDQSDLRAGFSGYGATSVDLAAPGVSILSATRFSDVSYGSKSGTSMASPHAAGAAALLAAANPNLSAASLKATLMNTVNQLGQWNGVVKSGGRLNVANAIQNPTVCDFVLSQVGANPPAEGGSFSVNVTAPQNCDFRAIADVPWITITGGNPGSGNTTVTFTVSSNMSGPPRSGVIRIADKNFGVVQNGVVSPPTQNKAVIDYDGDGKTDITAIRDTGFNTPMIWDNYLSRDGYRQLQFGLYSLDLPVPADFDGDGKTDFAVYRAGLNGTQSYFYVLRSSSNTIQSLAWGTTYDEPQTDVDYDGDGKADFAITRLVNNSSLYWYVLKSSGGYFAVQFGNETDRAVRGDFDGDGKTDVAVYRGYYGSPANRFFILKSSTGEFLSVPFGDALTDDPVSADFDGDRKTDIAVYRTSTGFWYWLDSSNGQFRAIQFGQVGDDPTPGDFDGDGKTDQAVLRLSPQTNPSNTFYINRSTGGFTAFGAGGIGRIMTPNGNFRTSFGGIIVPIRSTFW